VFGVIRPSPVKRDYRKVADTAKCQIPTGMLLRHNTAMSDMNSIESYRCATCSESHSGLPMSFAANFPDMYANMKEDERDAHTTIGFDQCIIDQKWFFIRGCLEIPIVGHNEPFLWGVWASVRQEVFDEISDCWEQQGRESLHGPFKGRLDNSLKVYPETLNLKVNILLQSVGTRPLFIVEEAEHPLAIEQKFGITLEAAMELASLLLHTE
jgi:hypothetical protein